MFVFLSLCRIEVNTHLCSVHADAVLKGTNVDGVFVCDSRNNNGIVAEQITSGELSSTGTPPMDAMAVRFCEENGISG